MRFFSAVLLLSILPLSTAVGQTVQANRNSQFNPRSEEGFFDLVAYVDGEMFVNIRDTGYTTQLLNGTPIQDSGSNFSQPIPRAVFGTFNMEKIAGRGTVTLVMEPTPQNQYTAVIRIKDDKAGRELYHVRLSWTWNPSNPSRPPRGGASIPLESRRNDPEDYNRNRDGVFQFSGRVDGEAVLHIHADQVRVEILSGQSLRDQRFQFSQPLPTSELKVIELTDFTGRGRVELVEKPWQGNRYTAKVRITDNSPGSSSYSFKLAWRR